MTSGRTDPAPPAPLNLATLLVEVAELTDEVILVTDTGSVDEPGPAIVYVNPAFTRMSGYRTDELIGLTPRVLQGPKTNPAACAQIRSALEHWQPIRIELDNYRKDGSEFEVELTIVPLADQNGWFRYWVSVQRELPAASHSAPPSGALSLYFSLLWLIQRGDRTMRSERTLALETASMAAIDQWVASVARGAGGAAASDGPARHPEPPPDEQRTAAVARDGARAVEAISARIAELLDSPRARAPDIRAIDVVAVLRDCVANHQGTFGRRQQVLSFDSSVPQAVCAADAGLLAQVLARLLANASEAMVVGQRCHVSVAALPGQAIRIEVSDTGSGVAPEALPNVFNPFYTTKRPGLGLGLPLARVIVERFGGRMHLVSQPGAGTNVRIDLPQG